MVNSRPSTYMPVISKEPEAVTPNHFVLGSSEALNCSVNLKMLLTIRCLSKYHYYNVLISGRGGDVASQTNGYSEKIN